MYIDENDKKNKFNLAIYLSLLPCNITHNKVHTIQPKLSVNYCRHGQYPHALFVSIINEVSQLPKMVYYMYTKYIIYCVKFIICLYFKYL